jgi:hypothetical protein
VDSCSKSEISRGNSVCKPVKIISRICDREITGMANSQRENRARKPDNHKAYLINNGDPPALLGRPSQFDRYGNLIVTPKREPTSSTLRRNHETSRKFKPHTVGV